MTISRTSAAGAGPPRARLRRLYRYLAIVAGALGLGVGVVVTATPALATASQWIAVSAGTSHTCAIKVDTTVWCWGANASGQLGTNDNADRSSPAAVQSAGLSTGWTVISAGADFTCGIRNGLRYCWGLNSSGQLGLGDYTNRSLPSRHPVEKPTWATVDAGLRHACGVRTTGTGQCWGNNGHGQLGLGDTTARNAATTISGAWTSMSAGSYHTCGIDSTGHRLCWGRNNAKQLGMASISFFDQLTPYQDPGDGSYAVVESGDGTTCAVAANKNLLCWGVNTYGNVGNGNTTPSDSTISTLSWATTSSGGLHACAIRTTGTIYCWGRNDAGQLGLGNNTDKLTETALSSANQSPTWSAVTAGLRHTCGIRADKTLYCWGYNVNGQLGVGSTVNKTTPTLVP